MTRRVSKCPPNGVEQKSGELFVRSPSTRAFSLVALYGNERVCELNRPIKISITTPQAARLKKSTEIKERFQPGKERRRGRVYLHNVTCISCDKIATNCIENVLLKERLTDIEAFSSSCEPTRCYVTSFAVIASGDLLFHLCALQTGRRMEEVVKQ